MLYTHTVNVCEKKQTTANVEKVEKWKLTLHLTLREIYQPHPQSPQTLLQYHLDICLRGE